MIAISSENGLPEYVGYVNCIEYKIKICHKYFTIPVGIKTKGMKLPSFLIYYISIGLMCKSALQNVRTLPGADRQLLLAKLNQRPRAIFPVRKREDNHGSHKLL